MSVITHLDAHANAGQRGYCRNTRWRVIVNGKELKRCTFVFALFGVGLAMFYVERDGELLIDYDAGEVVEGVTFGRIKAERL